MCLILLNHTSGFLFFNKKETKKEEIHSLKVLEKQNDSHFSWNMLIPGMYQLKRTPLKGALIFATECVLLTIGIGSIIISNRAYNEYLDIDNDGIKDYKDISLDKSVTLKDFNDKIYYSNTFLLIAQAAFSSCGGIFLYSFITAWLTSGKEQLKQKATLTNNFFIINSNSSKVIVCYQRKF